jgi:4-hydroxythreonine-4-phosphate dehydrogenase
MKPLALTMGEPAGIGGELSLKAWQQRDRSGSAVFFVIDDPVRLRSLAEACGLPVPVAAIDCAREAAAAFAHALPVLPLPMPVTATVGQPSPATAAAVIASIRLAVRLALQGEAAAVVTNPIQKAALYDAGFAFAGHTEYIASLAGAAPEAAVMMLASPRLRVVPVTVHMSLRQALETLSEQRIVDVATITAGALRADFGIAKPRLAVAGLNPHAGEQGAMGTEDEQIVAPAVHRLQAAGIAAEGPLPPDTLFTPLARDCYDAAICMYHDQALIPLKALDFDAGVNVTLGLPLVRTSPDHGTALDLAGSGRARAGSLLAALRLAAEIAGRRATISATSC